MFHKKTNPQIKVYVMFHKKNKNKKSSNKIFTNKKLQIKVDIMCHNKKENVKKRFTKKTEIFGD